MNITGIAFKFLFFTAMTDQALDFEVPFAGEDKAITQINRTSFGTEIKRFSMPDETRDKFIALIDKYDITSWIGITPALPEVNDSGIGKKIGLLTLKTDDGTSHKITFRETENGSEASVEMRKLCFDSTKEELKISEETIYPSLNDCRGIKEEHGPVIGVETSHFSMGMMYGSNQTTTQIVEKVAGKDNTVLVTYKIQAGQSPEASSSKEITSDIFAKVQELSDKENLPAWRYACMDPSIPIDRSMMATDYSARSSVTLCYDDSLITGNPRTRCSIGSTEYYMKTPEEQSIIYKLVDECVAQSGLSEQVKALAMPGPGPNDMFNPLMSGFMGMGMVSPGNQQTQQISEQISNEISNENSEWTCKACGQTGLTGKFCYNCGSSRC